MGLRCALFGHRRSGERAEYSRTRKRWRSICKRCGLPMAKVGERWMTAGKADREQTHAQPGSGEQMAPPSDGPLG